MLLFNFDIIDEEAYYDRIDVIVFAEGYYAYESGISMYAGYDETGQQLPVLEAIRDVTTNNHGLSDQRKITEHYR